MIEFNNGTMKTVEQLITIHGEVEVTPQQFWAIVLPWCLYQTKYKPQKCIELITCNKELAEFITPKMVEDEFYSSNKNLEYLMDEIFYRYNINPKYGIQSSDISELEEVVAEFFKVDYTDDVITLSPRE